MPAELKLLEVGSGVFAAIGPDGAANSGFVVGDEAVALIDAQASPPLGARLRELVASVTRAPVRYAVITHHHGDHLFGIQAWPDVTVLAHPECGRVLRELAGPEQSTEDVPLDAAALLRIFVGPLAAKRLSRLDDHPIRRRLAGDDYRDVRLTLPEALPVGPPGAQAELDLGGVILRISHPGPAHGSDDLIVDVPGRDVTFLGDLGFVDRVPAVTSPYVAEWISLTRRLIQRPVTLVVPGHGRPAAPERLRTQHDYLAALLADDATALSGYRSLPGYDRWHELNRLATAGSRG